MAQSKRWHDLRREALALRRHFLPRTFDLLGQYSRPTQVQARTRAFLVLSHAEVETYLEGWAKEIARKCETVWQSTGKVTPPLAVLIVTSGHRVTVADKLATKPELEIPRLVEGVIDKRLQEFYKQIRDNNGVKEKNVLSMFSPLGAPNTAFGSTLLPNLDSFGSLRGEYAHNSAQAVKAVPDPEVEYKRVIDLVDELKVLDEWLMQCRQRVQ